MVLLMYVFLVLTIILVDLRISQATSRVTLHELPIDAYHQQWMTQFSRVYSDESEKQMRYEVFKKNIKYIEDFNNKANQSYKLGVNEFTDMTREEFLATHTGLNINISSLPQKADKKITPPNQNVNTDGGHYFIKDWRDEGAVTPIKSQGEKCSDCWAFATVAAVEGLTKITQGKLISLSEQQLLDCGQSRDGCLGGSISGAYDYIVQNGGISAEDGYPYTEQKGTCKTNITPVMKISGYNWVEENDEIWLMDVVLKQPVSVTITAKVDSFLYYSGGVYDDRNCGFDVNHAVTLVGYGTTPEGIPYWLAKNSWGTTWGENGYMRLRRRVEWPQGMCGLAQQALYPVA